MDIFKKHTTWVMASIALILSACNTFTDLRPPPNIYANAQGPAEVALTTIKAFGAAQDTIEVTCTPVADVPDHPLTDACIGLITAEQTLRPAVSAAALVGAEYSDIDARIRELGPNAPAEWLLAAAEVAGRLSAAYDPIRAEVDSFIEKAGALTNG